MLEVNFLKSLIKEYVCGVVLVVNNKMWMFLDYDVLNRVYDRV